MTTQLTSSNIALKNFAVDWQAVKTSNFTAVAGEGYFVNTTSAAITVTLPASAEIGDIIRIKDYAGTFASNNLTIARNGHNIQGVANDSLISTNRASVSLFYVDSTKGWLYNNESNVADLEGPRFITATGGTITTSGDFKIHTFTGDGCFVVTLVGGCGPTDGPSNVDYLVVAGGGSSGNGASSQPSGGGGAGGYRTSFPSPGCNAGSFPISVTTYPITVGGGGAAAPYPVGIGCNGSPSIFSTITSAGGGYGGRRNVGSGNPGGSGGGGGASPCAAGTGNSPPVSPPQGNNGGIGDQSAAYYSGGGGGGASAAGTRGFSASPGTAGTGGAGSPNSISGSATFYAGGGGGFVSSPIGTGGSGGAGGGGQGQIGSTPSTSGTANTGGGGGAGSPAGAGGKGIVIIRYKYQ